MRLVRYFAGVSAGATLLILFSLVVLVVAVTLVENAGDISDADAGMLAAAWLSYFNAIQFSHQVLPISCFLGALVAGTLLARRGELLAAQAAGVSSLKLISSFGAVVIMAALLGSACGELWVPRAVHGIERVEREYLHQRSALTRFYQRRSHWFREGDFLLFLPVVNAEEAVFESPVVYRFEQSLIRDVIEAESMQHEEGGWTLRGVRVRSAAEAGIQELEQMPLALTVSPRDLIDVTGDPRQMSGPEISALIDRRENAGFDATSHRVELHGRFALPASALWMFFLVAPWTIHPDRRRSMTVTLGVGVAVIAVLLSVSQVFRSLALGHTIPAALGAWGPGVFCLFVTPLSAWAYQRYRVRGSLF